jgi:hypothetical protein
VVASLRIKDGTYHLILTTMKTSTFIITTLFVLAGSNICIQAQGSRGKEKGQSSQKKVVRVESTTKKSDKTTNRTSVQIQSNRNGNGSRSEVRVENNRIVETRPTNVQVENNRDVDSRPGIGREENERGRADIRNEVRENNARFRDVRANNQYREFKQRCSYCSGRGFTLQLDGFRHINCVHCNGVGFRLLRELYLGAVAISGNYNIREMARIETDQLDAVLELSRRQWDRIYRINYEYISRNEHDRFFSEVRWERDIRRELTTRQRIDYTYYLDEIRRDSYANEYRY